MHQAIEGNLLNEKSVTGAVAGQFSINPASCEQAVWNLREELVEVLAPSRQFHLQINHRLYLTNLSSDSTAWITPKRTCVGEAMLFAELSKQRINNSKMFSEPLIVFW